MKNPLVHLILAGILLVVAIVGYGLWFVAVDTENAQAQSLADEIQTKSQDASRIAQAKQALEALSTDETSVYQHFVSASDIVPFLSSLESTGKALGSTVSVVSVGSDTSKTKVGHLNLSLSITGPFDSVIRTLGAFEYSPYDIVLTNLTLNNASASSWTAAAAFSVGTGVSSTTPAAAHSASTVPISANKEINP